MIRAAPLLAVLAAAACAPMPRGAANDGPRLRPAADPSAVIAAEIAFSRLAQDKGQWTAFRETAAPEAELFVPERVKARDWLKGRADPSVPVRWQARAVWSSCDGSYAVTRGDWQRPGATGAYATVWQRQPDGAYRWLLDMSLGSERPAAEPDSIAAQVADCPPRRAGGGAPAPVPATAAGQGASRDGTLAWASRDGPGGLRALSVSLLRGGRMETVLDLPAAPAR